MTSSHALPTPRSADHLEVGRAGERAAELAYVRRGYRVLARNWRCRIGELDLVLARGDRVVFCEVKTRRSGRFGEPWEAVDPRKKAKLRNVAQAFLISCDLRPASTRFDVASVTVGNGPTRDALVRVYEDAF